MVEENAATARTLEQQAADMDERIGRFRLGKFDTVTLDVVGKRPAPMITKKPAARGLRGRCRRR